VVYSRKKRASFFDSLTESIAQRFKEEVQHEAPPDLQYMWYQ
jgi:hypothetical protein